MLASPLAAVGRRLPAKSAPPRAATTVPPAPGDPVWSAFDVSGPTNVFPSLACPTQLALPLATANAGAANATIKTPARARLRSTPTGARVSPGGNSWLPVPFLSLASDQPDQQRQQPEPHEHRPGPLDNRLLARGAEVESLGLLASAAWPLPCARLGPRGLGARGGLLGAPGDDGALDRSPGHDGWVLAAYHPAGGAAYPAGGGGGGLRRGRAVARVRRGLGLGRARDGGSVFGAAGDLTLQALGELVEHLGRHVLGDAAPELGGAPGQLHVGLDADLRAVLTLPLEGRDDGRRGRALASSVAAGGLQHGAVILLIGLLDLDRALVVGGDRADLDLHRAVVLAIALLLLYGGPWQARGDLLEVQHDVPGLPDGYAHRELVVYLHRVSSFERRSCASSLAHATSLTLS